jgi:hypothetical protein
VLVVTSEPCLFPIRYACRKDQVWAHLLELLQLEKRIAVLALRGVDISGFLISSLYLFLGYTTHILARPRLQSAI